MELIGVGTEGGVLPRTERLLLREMDEGDLPALKRTLQDGLAMCAYEGAFSDAEVADWLARRRQSYADHGHGLWAVILRATGEMIGQCGISHQSVDGVGVLEVGYLFERAHWHQGYAVEAARACVRWAFAELRPDAVHALIRETNLASMNVAIRLGMTVRGRFTKHYRGVDMPHFDFALAAGPRT